MTDNIREKTRAVFLAVIMAVSVVAMTASFAGAAAAANEENPTQGTEFTIGNTTVLSEQLYDTATQQRVVNDGVNRNAGTFNSEFNVATESGLLGVPFEYSPFDDQAISTAKAQFNQSHTLGPVYLESGTEYQVTIDASETADAGIDITNVDVGLISGDYKNISKDVSDAGVITLTIYGNDSPAKFEVTPTLEADDIEEGLNIEEATESIRHSVEIGAVQDDGSTNTIYSDNADYRLTDTGQIGIGEDAGSKFLGSTVDIPTSFNGADNVSGAKNAGWDVWSGTTLSFQASGDQTVVEIFEAQRNNDQEWELGDREIIRGTAPGNTTSINTDTLSNADGEYFVVFNEEDTESDKVVYIDLRSLGLDASFDDEDNQVPINQDIDLDVSANDVGQTPYDGDIQAWFIEAGDQAGAANTIHVEEGSLDGDGSATLTVDAEDDLNAEGGDKYYAVVAHLESNNVVLTDTLEVVEEPDAQVNIEAPVPPQEDNYVRGDIIPIRLSFENTDVGTLTFGDRSPNADEGEGQNFEMNVTVRDSDDNGEALVYLNTFQIGDNRTADDSGNEGYYNQFDFVYSPSNATANDYDLDSGEGINHGFQAGPGTDIEAPEDYDDNRPGDVVDVYSPEHDIAGGSAGGAVIAGSQTYDLYVTSTELSHKLEGSNPTDQSAVRIQQREELTDDDLKLWNAPGSGSSEIDPETAQQINESEVITPADGTLADNDFLIFQASTGGLEGVIYDALLKNSSQSDTTMHELLDQEARGGDDVITDEFFADPGLLGLTLDEQADINLAGPNQRLEDPQTITLGPDVAQSVIVDSNNAGFRNYYIPVKLASGQTRENLEVGTEFEGTFSFEPPRADDQFGNEPGLIPENSAFSSSLEEANVSFEFRDDATFVDTGGEDRLVVPAEDNVTISGSTNIAAGTELLFTVRSVSGVDEPLFERFRTSVEYQEDANNTWSFDVPYQFNNTVLEDTEFSIGSKRNQDTDQLMRVDGDATEFPGAIAPETTVNSLAISDQQVADEGAQVVLIDQANLSSSGVVAIEDADGNILGQTDTLAADMTHENIAVVLDQRVEDTTEVEAVAYSNVDERREFAEGDVRVGATLEVGEPVPANFDVGGLDPSTVTFAPGDDTQEDISVTVTNTGEVEATQSIVLALDGSTEDTTSVTLGAGESEDVTLTLDASDLAAGEYSYVVSSDDAESVEGTLTIQQPATFEITDFSPESATVTEGEEVEASVTIENTGDLEGTQTVTLSGDQGLGELGTAEGVTLGAGDSTSETFTFTAPEVEEDTTYTHTLATEDDEVSGELTVENEAPADNGTSDDGGDNESDSEDGDDSGPGFGIAAALVALLGAALLAYRRRLE